MDELLELGILARPETIGVTPMFTSPSMLVPKPDAEGGWRFVTDFTQLNNYIRKMPTSSPTIEETRLQIASFKFIVCIDLSQFYFQNRIDRESTQYLGVIHPYKGTMVYTASPMGLRNSSEIAYERLKRVFGDMQRNQKLCQQADALIVGGNTVEVLFENLTEVFKRLRACNMTIKPSKLIICPKKTILFGWEFSDQAWRPTTHKINPLVSAPEPLTVKQLRSWLGASKQLSSGLHNYSAIFQPLEKMTGGRGSNEKLTWTAQSSRDFKMAKDSLKTIKDTYYPTPDDQIHTFSDFSQDAAAVGGRLQFVRTTPDGKQETFHGGFFSATLNNYQKRWLPCEAECLGVKLVLDHFGPILRESRNTVIHHCDNLPTVMAYARLRQGKFSASARIAAFLTTVNEYDVQLVHTAGKDLALTDYISRHPTICSESKCQICNFVKEQVEIGDAIVNKITMEDILQGRHGVPYLQPRTWTALQKKDNLLVKLSKLIKSGQKPEEKKTGGENTPLNCFMVNMPKET